MVRRRDRTSATTRGARPTPGCYPIDSGTAELVPDRDNPDGYLLKINGAESSHLDLADPTRLEFEYMRWIASVVEHSGVEHRSVEHRSVEHSITREQNVAAGPSIRMLHLGAAACSLARHFLATNPGSQHLAVDLDAELARLVREWFDLPKAPALRIRVGDARAVTEALPDAGFSVVIRDVFAGTITPPSLTTVEFARQVRRVLRPDGLYLLNCGDAADLRLSRLEAATLAAVFGFVAIVADPPMLKGRRRGNVIIIGSDAPVGSAGLTRELLGGAVPAQFWDDRRVRKFAHNSVPLTDPPPVPLIGPPTTP